jgi:hypothetical protein
MKTIPPRSLLLWWTNFAQQVRRSLGCKRDINEGQLRPTAVGRAPPVEPIPSLPRLMPRVVGDPCRPIKVACGLPAPPLFEVNYVPPVLPLSLIPQPVVVFGRHLLPDPCPCRATSVHTPCCVRFLPVGHLNGTEGDIEHLPFPPFFCETGCSQIAKFSCIVGFFYFFSLDYLAFFFETKLGEVTTL